MDEKDSLPDTEESSELGLTIVLVVQWCFESSYAFEYIV